MKIINGKDFRRMVIAGANRLQKHRQLVDELNVFPVPDGDTGSNMSMTLITVAREVKKCDSEVLEETAKVVSSGALRGARGNSGVITSQIFRGLYNGFKEKSEATVADFATALASATESAYKAVMKPKEGTMLTIIRAISEKAIEIKDQDIEMEEFMETIISFGNEMLDKTPDMLPVLKEAGVVDSGGKGLIFIFEGMLKGLTAEAEEDIDEAVTADSSASSAQSMFNTEDIKFMYCTEFLTNKEDYSESKIKRLHAFLENAGDSLVLVDDEEIVKVHVHTNHPGDVIERALEIGSLISVKIENMKQQHSSLIDSKPEATEMPKKDIGFIAVCAGTGMSDILTNLKIDHVIEGGQTMNPSTDDFMEAIAKVNADNIIIFPNNKNIILAAKQAQELCEDKNIVVIETRTVPESITAMINYAEGTDIETVTEEMNEIIGDVTTAQVTYAVRDTSVKGMKITKGDIIGIIDDEITVVGKTVTEVTNNIIDKLAEAKPDLISIYKGCDAKDDETDAIVSETEDKYPRLDVEVEDGKQPLYYYIISAE